MLKIDFYKIVRKHGIKKLYCPVKKRYIKRGTCFRCRQPITHCDSFRLLDLCIRTMYRLIFKSYKSYEELVKEIQAITRSFNIQMRQYKKDNYTEKYIGKHNKIKT